MAGHEIVSVGTESDVRRGLETRTHATVELGQAALLPGIRGLLVLSLEEAPGPAPLSFYGSG